MLHGRDGVRDGWWAVLMCFFMLSWHAFLCFFSGVASVWPLSHKAEICEVLQRLLSFRQVFSSQPRNSSSVRVIIGFLVTSLTKVLLAQLLSLVRWLDLGRVWVVPCCFHCLMMELSVLLGSLCTLEIVLHPSQDLCLLTTRSRSSTDISLDFIVEFLL